MKNTDDAKQELLNAISSNTPRRNVGGIAVNLAGRRGGSSGPTTYTKSVSNDDINKELTVTNVVDGIPQQPYKINYGELPIAYYETYDSSKLIEGFLTYFNSGAGRGLWYKNQNGQIKKLFTIGEYPDGYFTNVNVNLTTNELNIFREGRPTLQYKPIIKSYTYSNTDTHSFNIDEEKFWTLTIPSTSFDENTNVLNVRIGSVDTSNSGHLRNSFVSTWEITNNNLIVRVYMKNTLGIQLDVVNVSLIIETI